MKYTLLGCFLGVLLVVTGWACAPTSSDRSNPNAPLPPQSVRWEYKTLVVEGLPLSRTDAGAMDPGSVKVAESDLNALGQEDWELVSTWVEEETAFPNLGDAKYVTGLQPNIRPKRVVLVFKRQSTK